MLNLYELIGIKKEDFCKYKVHFAIGGEKRKEPYETFLRGDFKDWQERQTGKNWTREYIVSLIYYEKDVWMFGGVYKVLPTKPVAIEGENGWHGWKYETELLDLAAEYIGRAFFRFKKEFRMSYTLLELDPKNGDPVAEMTLSHILDKRVALSDFPGFDRVNIDYKTLKYIISDGIASWRSALSKVKGVYLIVDTKTGRQYVGSAYGEECLWHRLEAYAKNGHGNNVDLKRILKENGEEYKYFFKYSILEVCNMNLGNDYIIERESYWKDVLLTREFGFNNN